MAFNDKDASVIASLTAAFGSIANVTQLQYAPQYFPHEVSLAIAEHLHDYRSFPTLLRELADDLVRSFAGQTITFEDLFRRHSPGKNYVERNYRAALSLLVDAGRVTCDPPASTMRFRSGKRTWPKQTRIIFPPR
jgi:hypothetical protein